MRILSQNNEFCVCELTVTLQEHQAKTSRHLTLLKQAELIQDRRQGQWVFYQLHERLPHWARETLRVALREN